MNRRSRSIRVALTALVLLVLAQPLFACPVCYGDPTSAAGKSMSNAVIFLLVIIGLVQIGFVALFWTFWKRARNIQKTKESFRLIQGTSR